MSRKKRKKKPMPSGGTLPHQQYRPGNPEPLPFHGSSAGGAAADAWRAGDPDAEPTPEEAAQILNELRAKDPALLEQMLGEYQKWHDDFAREHGREPDIEDLGAVFDADVSEEELAELA